MRECKTIECVGKKCTGCRACEQICPKSCISMKKNEEGFLYPTINKNRCINCGMCKQTCHVENKYKETTKTQEVYAMKPKNENISKKSTSGGMFFILAKYVLQQNGSVYGCAFTNELKAQHVRIKKEEELDKLRGSKYVISDTSNMFSNVKEDLNNNQFVLFTGTPCQIAGLKKFLNKDYEKLITMDFVCHGVPSQELFSNYIKWLENKLNDKIINYEFRNKEKKDWGIEFTAKIETKRGIIKYLKADFDPYYSAFLSGKIYRECCYECEYASVKRVSDITVGDFWGIEKIEPSFYSELGVSLIIVNTKKGEKILEEIKDDLILKNVTMNDAIKKNHNLTHPSEKKVERKEIYIKMDNFGNCAKKYMLPKNKIKIIVKNAIPKKIKLFLKKHI